MKENESEVFTLSHLLEGKTTLSKRFLTTACAALLTCILPARALLAEAQLPKAVAPFVQEGAIALLVVDFAKVDIAAFNAQTLAAMKLAGLNDAELAQRKIELEKETGKGKPWVERLAKVPGGQMFVLQQSGLMRRPAPMFIIPVADDAHAKELEAFFDSPEGMEMMGLHAAEGAKTYPRARIGDALVLAEDERTVTAAKRIKPVDRPDVAAALQAGLGGNATIRGVFVPDLMMRNMFAGLGNSQIGPGAGDTLSNGIEWIGLSGRVTPDKSFVMTIKSESPEAAAALDELVDSMIERAPPTVSETIAKLNPVVKEDTVVLSFDNAAIDGLVAQVGPSMLQARETAMRVQSASNIRQLSMMVLMYSNENNNAAPASLDDLRKYGSNDASFDNLTTNPLQPNRKPGYVYVKPAAGATNQTTVSIYEAFDTWPGAVNVGFVDGSVQLIESEAKFNELLNDAK